MIGSKHIGILKHPGYNSGGGGGGNTTATTTTSNLPEYARPYFEDVMGRTQQATLTPYTQYGGSRVAGFSPYQQAGQQLTAATALSGTPGAMLAGQEAGLQAAERASGFGYDPMQFSRGPDAADAATVQAYMSPYMQNVVDTEKLAAVRDYQLAGQVRNQQAVQAGAFGGSRQAVAEAEAQRGLMSQLQGIQSKGSQSAFEQAQQALQAQRIAGLEAQKATEASRQFGATSGLQASEQLGRIGQGLSDMGRAEQQAALDRAQALGQAGREQQSLQQQQLDQAYADFAAQRDYEMNMINWYNSIMRGVPVTANQSVYNTAPSPSMASQVAGMGLAGLGAYNAMK